MQLCTVELPLFLTVLPAGKSTLGLAYGLSAAEAVIAPAMPSTTARAGGIFMPIIASLSQQADSKPSELQWGGPGRARDHECARAAALLLLGMCWAA